ncbi:MAG: hypothetical protein LBQ35_00190 [Spirochaetaceae bacterium]|jgi:hypothetical protein|nr:hypothetical protein [Spirochaetaceae bacterium]
MKRNGIFIAAAGAILLLWAGCASTMSGGSSYQQAPASGTGRPRITIRNNTGATIYYVYISPASSGSWGADWLGSSEVLSNGDSRTFTLAQPLSVENRYDFRVAYLNRDENSFEKYNQTITGDTVITFTQADRVRIPDGPQITIRNNTGVTAYYVNISPASSESWGSDWLGSSEVIANGNSRTFTLTWPLNVQNRYDLRIRTNHGDTSFERRNQTISNNAVITFTEADRAGGPPEDYRANANRAIAVTLGKSYRRNIGTGNVQIYGVVTSPGQSVVAWTEGSMDTRITVFTSRGLEQFSNSAVPDAGEILGRDDDSGSGSNARVSVTVPRNESVGIFVVVDIVDNKAGTYVFCTREGQ